MILHLFHLEARPSLNPNARHRHPRQLPPGACRLSTDLSKLSKPFLKDQAQVLQRVVKGPKVELPPPPELSTRTPIASKDAASGPYQGHSRQSCRSTVTEGVDCAPKFLGRHRCPLWWKRCTLLRIMYTRPCILTVTASSSYQHPLSSA
jgi:hypothetical protein